jgi:predicted MPP superfamily phosphohydrolase
MHVRELDVEIAGLPPAFEGYRIAQLSDTHVGALTPPERARSWVALANTLSADLFALTGDYVTSGTRFHEAAARAFGELKARDGTMAVLGNHDNFGGCEPLATTLREVGIALLQNEHRVVERDGARLAIVGVDDVFTKRADVEKSFRDVPRGVAIVGLAHDPRLFPAMAARGAGLVLSGHTHWGQIGVPFLHRILNIARPFFRFPGGMFEGEGGAKLWVHPGMGTTGPPVRLGVAPEITVLVLRGKKAS